MTIPFTRWPEEFARRYREKGYWQDLPLTHILTDHAEKDTVAIIDGERHLTWRAFNQAVNNLASALQGQGVRRGETALVQLGNVAEFYITFFALLQVGVAPVNALFSHQRNELNAYAAQIKPALLIADREHALFAGDDFLNRFVDEHRSVRVVLLRGDNGAHALEAAIAHPATHFIPNPTPADEVAFFQLSGGSTGTPKLIPRTHNDYDYSIRRSNEICGITADTRYLNALPAAHNYAMSSPGSLGVFMAGGCVVLAHDPSATICFPLIERHQINVTSLVPPAVSLWLQAIADGAGNAQLKSLKLLQVGGARLSATLAARIPAEIGCQLQQVFGMAEGLVNYTALDDTPERIIHTQGRPMCPDDEVWVADEQGNPLPRGETGRLMTRGPYTFRGYFNSPEHNASAFDANGFYCSGDLIAIDEQGYITVQGREKDQINRGGEKIAAEEIENLLLRHEAVIHAALVSMEDSLLGEKSCAFLVVKQPLRAVEVRRFLREQGVAEFKLPDRVESVDALPLTPVGKVDKKQLRLWIAERARPEEQSMAIPKLTAYALPTAAELPTSKVNWAFEPERAALLIHDMQEYFLNFWGENSAMMQQVVANIARLRTYCKAHNIPVYYTAQPKEQSDEDRALLNDMWGPGLTRSPEQQRIVAELTPDEADTVLVKWRYSAFHRSPLELMLKETGRNQLLITGVYAHIGCMTTATDAFMRDIKPFFIADALADFTREEHLMSLNYVAGRSGRVVMTDDLLPSVPASKAALRELILPLLDETDEPMDDENLIDYGLDSVRMMALAARWRKVHGDIDFVMLAKNPTLDAWWALLSREVQ
ncbi:2,3-dihydroxybenzoate-AMP ligase [Enterobacter cloacae]|uniref:isochorismatase n=3 Tax=Enterobacter cloacae TaxID=550 RepID=A0A377M4K1_ENTCL|nr:2,3-dihydroxybenzoate-AMP ligase [Enterobacter cloacae]